MPYIPIGCNCSCCTDVTLRQFAFICNLIFALFAVGVIICGISYRSHFVQYQEILPQDDLLLAYIPYIGVAFGILYVTSSIVILIGVVRTRNSNGNILLICGCIIGWASLFLTSLHALYHLIIFEVKGIGCEIRKCLIKIFRSYHEDKNAEQLVHQLQQDFSCCGITGPKYWYNDFPDSCFPKRNIQSDNFRIGCKYPISKWLRYSLGVVTFIYVASHIMHIISLISAGCLSERMVLNRLTDILETDLENEEDAGYISDDEDSDPKTR
ncbi:23 kDa integral membrane protein-like [Anthonomus grandis grandis]|uniref:23 kDa integral membrane protein-like n=1 Tax=Anthonomus grandis grandis TaxID=2921223 RepID=UPI002164FC2B|nr:23 kDa integral membrane protein-like [Anthonomus grandis grandis]